MNDWNRDDGDDGSEPCNICGTPVTALPMRVWRERADPYGRRPRIQAVSPGEGWFEALRLCASCCHQFFRPGSAFGPERSTGEASGAGEPARDWRGEGQ
jgi:hypothetical protein